MDRKTKRAKAPRRKTQKASPARPAKKSRRPGARKLAVSFEAPLADQIQLAASQETHGNVSAWLADAARQKIRQRALAEAVAAYEAEHGEITSEELGEVRRAWPQA
jgi:hypothetical protein